MTSLNTTSRPARRRSRNPGRTRGRVTEELMRSGIVSSAQKVANRARMNHSKFECANNGYAKTLEDPFKTIPVTVPDLAIYDTALVKMVYRLEVTPVQDPTTGIYHAGIMVNSWRPDGMVNRMTAIGTLPVDVITWAPTGLINPNASGGQMPNYPAFEALARSYRVVSAGMTISGTMASLNDEGYQVAVNLPGQQPLSGFSAPTQFNSQGAVNNAYTAVRSPVKEGGACICFKPTGPETLIFTDTDPIVLTPPSNTYYGGAVWMASGLNEGSTFTATICINLEFIPRLTTTSYVDLGPSISDSLAMDHAVNTVARTPSVEMGPEAARKSQSVSREGIQHLDHPMSRAGPSEEASHTPSLFEKGLDRILSLATNVVPKILPLLMDVL